jgi:hypothetical protein
MKSLLFFLLCTLSVVASANDTQPVPKQTSFFDSTQTKVEAWQLGGMSTTLEFMSSSGLRLEIEDIQPVVTLREVEQYGELDRVRLYGITWQPRSHILGIGLEREVTSQGDRESTRTRLSLRASKTFERDGWEWSFSLKPLWHHEEGKNPLGAMFWIRIDN